MAARVGSGVTGTSDGNAATIASATKSTTTGNMLVAWVKWETETAVGIPTTLSSLADTAGNSWVIAEQGQSGGNDEPRGALCYALNITGHASNVVTATFGANAAYRRIIVEEFSGIKTSSATDGAAVESFGTTAAYTTGNISTSAAGLVVLGIADYTGLSSLTGTDGNPDFTVGANASDCFIAYLISGSAQTVTPGADSANNTQWYTAAQAFLDAAAGPTNATATPSGASSTSAVGSMTTIAAPPPPFTLMTITG